MMSLSTIGGFNTAQTTLWRGATLVLATTSGQVLRSLNLYKVRYLRASPQQLQGLVDMVRGRTVRFPTLERVEAGGAATPQSLVLGARATLCTNVVGVYGSTEAGLVAQAPSSLLFARSDAAGYVVPGVEVTIVDESGNPLSGTGEGIVRIRASHIAQSYLGDEAATASGFRDGWFYPGDLGRFGPDGVLHITGRADEMINAGGVKLSPMLVDEFLLAQPGIREAATFAHRQPGRADEVWAAVVCTDGFDEATVLATARAKLNSRAPVKLLRMQEIPRNAMGKPLRQQLTKQSAH
jgi:acyl-coenzyme A synthetase/AMP-(fatty) acid ligase